MPIIKYGKNPLLSKFLTWFSLVFSRSATSATVSNLSFKLAGINLSSFPSVSSSISFIVFLIFPQFKVLGALGFIGIPSGIGDYMNVFNALTQMPKGAKTYLNGFNSYWYLPEEKNK